MKKHIVYECEYCGKKSDNKNEILKCENSHIKLTEEEKFELMVLKRSVSHKYLQSRFANEQYAQCAVRNFNKSCEELLDFCKKHNIKVAFHERSIGCRVRIKRK